MNGGRTDLQTAELETTWGCIAIDAGAAGVVACRLPSAVAPLALFQVLRVRLPSDAKPILRQAVGFARALVEGRAPGACPALDPGVTQAASEFRRAVWQALRRVPCGRRVTYSELARRAKRPRAARAAGSACGANPLPLFIPCHRVLGVGGRLGGFSAGLAWKKQLLAGEEGGR